MPTEQGDFLRDLRATMNGHIKETSGDREPWVWILERAISEIESHQFTYPYAFDIEDGERCLILRPSHVMGPHGDDEPIAQRIRQSAGEVRPRVQAPASSMPA